jgi:hypothetical protein
MSEYDFIGALLVISLGGTATFPRNLRRFLHEDLVWHGLGELNLAFALEN